MLVTLLYFMAALLGVCFIVFVHELGHYVCAKIFGMSVSHFSIGFGKPLFKWRFKETEILFTPILLGGYIRLVGASGSSTANQEEIRSIEGDKASFRYKRLSDESTWYRNKSRLARSVMVMGGIAFNALFFFAMTPIVGMLAPQPAEASQIVKNDRRPYPIIFRAGDIVLRIGSTPLPSPSELKAISQSAQQGDLYDVSVARRRGDAWIFSVRALTGSQLSRLAVEPVSPSREVVLEANKALARQTSSARWVAFNLNDDVIPGDDVSGNTIIGFLYDGAVCASRGALPFLLWLAGLSWILLVFNILPFAVLDGGRLLAIVFGDEDRMFAATETPLSNSEASTPSTPPSPPRPFSLWTKRIVIACFIALLLGPSIWRDLDRMLVALITPR